MHDRRRTTAARRVQGQDRLRSCRRANPLSADRTDANGSAERGPPSKGLSPQVLVSIIATASITVRTSRLMRIWPSTTLPHRHACTARTGCRPGLQRVNMPRSGDHPAANVTQFSDVPAGWRARGKCATCRHSLVGQVALDPRQIRKHLAEKGDRFNRNRQP